MDHPILRLLLVDLSGNAAFVMMCIMVVVGIAIICRRVSVYQRMRHVEHMELQRFQHEERLRQADSSQRVIDHKPPPVRD